MMLSFCGKCGHPLEQYVSEGGYRRQRCPECGWKYYSNPIPVVLVLGVADDGRVLYTRKSTWPKGVWGLLSGIVEEGETSEEAVIREVREECGLEAVEPTYVGSDHIKGQLLLCFCARLVGDRPIPSSDADEVALDWPDPERIPQGVPARRLLERYMAKLPDGFWGGQMSVILEQDAGVLGRESQRH